MFRHKKRAAIRPTLSLRSALPIRYVMNTEAVPKTAEVARQAGFNAFTSTLLTSPHQKHDLLREVGNKLAKEKGLDFLYADLRKRYSDSRHMTKGLKLYRQQYCGCVYSEWERYANITL